VELRIITYFILSYVESTGVISYRLKHDDDNNNNNNNKQSRLSMEKDKK
jgi:hypothetical protein